MSTILLQKITTPLSLLAERACINKMASFLHSVLLVQIPVLMQLAIVITLKMSKTTQLVVKLVNTSYIHTYM